MKKILTLIAVSALAVSAVEASQLAMGKNDGFGDFTHDGASYAFAGNWAGSGPVLDIAVVSGGMHVIRSTGLTYYSYDGNTLTAGGSFGWGADTARAVGVASDGTVFAGGSSGFGAFTYSGGAYSSDAWYGNDTYSIGVDGNDIIHVQQSDGLGGWSYTPGLFSNTAWDAGWGAGTGVGALEIDSTGMLHVGKADGIGSVSYSGSAYAWAGGWSAGAGINDIYIDEASGQIWAGQSDGVQVVNQSTYASIAYGGFAGGISAVLVDSDGNAHLGKADGMIGVDIVGSGVVYDGSSWYAAAAVTEIVEVIPEPATLGLFALVGGGMMWMRKRFMI